MEGEVASGTRKPIFKIHDGEIMSIYDEINFILTDNAPQLKRSMKFDYNEIRNRYYDIPRPEHPNRKQRADFNQSYTELYKQFDNSTEYHRALDRDTFNGDYLMPTFDDLTEEYPEDRVPLLDQKSVAHQRQFLTPHQQFWAENGYLIAQGLIASEVCDEYIALRESLELGPHRFPTFTPYVEHDVIRRMCCSVAVNTIINDLIGEELGLHFNLSQYVSTERGWHQDEYLNPPQTFGRYLAVWIAIDDVPEASGPFEFVPGSHKLPTVARDKVMPFLKQEFQLGYSPSYDWSVHSASFVNPAYFYKMATSGAPPVKFLGKKGDVLFWHSRLIHRGSPPENRNIYRPGLIGHYSPIRSARWFGSDIRRYGNGGYYWHFDH